MIRSLLYVPLSSEKFLARAHERGADALILDLEDSVVATQKRAARDRLEKAVASAGRSGATVFVRINAGEPGLADAQAACRAGAFGLFVPKVRAPGDLMRIDTHLSRIERAGERVVLVAMLEDPGAVLDARNIAAASTRNFALVAGTEDMATAMGAEPTPEVLRLPKLLVHLAAKALGLFSFGMLRSVAEFREVAAIRQAAREARAVGFDGATCIHPSLVPILNEAFSPTADEVARARRLVEAFDKCKAAGQGAFVFEGKMVDAPVAARARALLAKVEPVPRE
jgi:citrate lyase subunit beta / citryl-CoA lyase